MANEKALVRALAHFMKVRPKPATCSTTSAPAKIGAVKSIPCFMVDQNTIIFAPAGLWPFEVGRTQFQRSAMEFGFKKLFPNAPKGAEDADALKKASRQFEYVRLVNMLAYGIVMAHRSIAQTNSGFNFNGHWIVPGAIVKKGDLPSEFVPIYKEEEKNTSETCFPQGL
jgi:hypothetical protein